METLTDFERRLQGDTRRSIRPVKALDYDPGNAMFYMPTTWAREPNAHAASHPSDEQLKQDAIAFVQGEFGSRTDRGDFSPSHNIESGIDSAIDELAFTYLNACDADIFSGAFDHLFNAKGRSDSELFRAVLSHESLGNRENSKYLTSSDFINSLDERMARKEPIQIVFPSFPFKDQNPFRTHLGPACVDLGEVALLTRLHSLALALYQIYAFGIQWIIVTDGSVYARTFGVQTDDAIEYREELRRWRNRLNLQSTIQIVDYDQIVQQIDSANTHDSFEQRRETLARRLYAMVLRDEAGELAQAIQTLQRGMRWNLESRRYVGKVEPEQLWRVLNSEPTTSGLTNVKDVEYDVKTRATVAAVQYLTFNLEMGHYSHGITHVFPRALRATVHPKLGQIAAPKPGIVYPWNGICLVSENPPTTCASLECIPLYVACRKHKQLLSKGTKLDSPFYYLPKQ